MINELQIKFDITLKLMEERCISDSSKSLTELYSSMTCNCFMRNQKKSVYKKAFEVIKTIPDDATNFNLNLIKGFIYLRNKKNKKAYKYLTNAIKTNNTIDISYSLRSTIKKKINPDFLDDEKHAVLLNPSARNYFMLASTFDYKEKNSECKKAVFFYGKAIELRPDFACAYYNRAIIFGNLNEVASEIKDYKKCIEINKNHWAYNNLSYVLFQEKRYEEAINYAKLGAYYHPKKNIYKYREGQANQELENYELAIECYEKYLEKKPKDSAGIFNIAFCYSALDNYSKALEYASLGAVIYPDIVNFQWLLGIVNQNLENYEFAIECYKKYLEKEPKDTSVIYEVSNCYDALENYPEALKYAKLGVKIKPNDIDFQWLLGFINQNIENYNIAIKHYKRYLEKNTNDEDVKSNIRTCINLLKKTQIDISSKSRLQEKKQIESSVKSSFMFEKDNTNIFQNKFVNYHSGFKDNKNFYPILKIPHFNCIVRTHKYGATKPSGFKDKSFEKSIKSLLSPKYEVSSNIKLETGIYTRSYEPDIAIICSTNKNIRIDIEIDEPYAGKTRQPTHCIGDDDNRDNYFTDRGWLVIRFSEYQVHTNEKECLKFILKVIKSIDNSFDIPTGFELINKELNEIMWNIVQAQKWEKDKYRETYLNHSFAIDNNQKDFFKNETNQFSSQDVEEEKLVKSTFLGIQDLGKNIGFNRKNAHVRDERIKFYSESHTYTIDGVPIPSVSTVISKFFPVFDAESKASNLSPRNPLFGLPVDKVLKIWKDKGTESAYKGTFLHEQIENYYLNRPYKETEEFYQFLNFVNDNNNLIPFRSEWRIFDEYYNIAGTIDLLVDNTNGTFDIYDWKRSKKIVNPYNGQLIEKDSWGNKAIGILKHLDDTSYNRYKLQQNLYKYILENRYNIKIKNMYLIVMHTDEGYNNYHKVKVSPLSNEIEKILEIL